MKRQRTKSVRRPVIKPASVIKIIAGGSIACVVGVLAVIYIGRGLKTLDYFKIKDIIMAQGIKADLAFLKGRNIFSLDLNKEAEGLSRLHPSYKKVRLIRVLPNRLFINFISRRPVARVRLYRYFCVDEEQVLFNIPDVSAEQELPVITGLENKISNPKPGVKYNLKELTVALNIAREARGFLRGYKVKSIDVASLPAASFIIFLPQELFLEVKTGPDNLRGKINVLANLIAQAKKDFQGIEYIDLRFKEPVIKLRESHAKQ